MFTKSRSTQALGDPPFALGRGCYDQAHDEAVQAQRLEERFGLGGFGKVVVGTHLHPITSKHPCKLLQPKH